MENDNKMDDILKKAEDVILRKIVEKETSKEVKKTVNLACKIFVAIESETDCSYRDVIQALEYVRGNYEKKGYDLLNQTSIQEVAKHDGLLA